MVIGRVFGYVAAQLRYFDFTLEFTLKAWKHDFSLAGFQTITHAGNWAFTVCYREKDKFFVDEVVIAQFGLWMVYETGNRVETSKPVFPSVCKLFGKCKFDHSVVLIVDVFELNFVGRQLRKVLFCLFCSWGTQTFVVLDFEVFAVGLVYDPLFVLWNCKKSFKGLQTLADFNNWRHKFF
jgi:hypothetical protein